MTYFRIECCLILGILLFQALVCALYGQPLVRTNADRQFILYGVEDGLSQGSVYSMLKDSRGFMWFTSLEGLNRFDGHHFKVYYPNKNDESSLQGITTIGMVEDPFGNIWVGTEVCLNRYLRNLDAFDAVYTYNESGHKISSTHYPFYADSTEVWYTSNQEGIVAYNYQTQTKRLLSDRFRYQWSMSVINSTLRGADGEIWIREQKGLTSLDPANGEVKHYFTGQEKVLGPPMSFICHFPAADSTLWLGLSGGIVHFIPAEGQWSYYPIKPEVNIADIRQAADGLLYLGTESDGLYVFQPDTGVITHFTTENSELPNRVAASLYLDDQGLLWINSDPQGIVVLFPQHNRFQRYGSSFFEPYEFTSPGIRCFAEAPNGNIWIGTEEDGVFVFDPQANTILKQFSPIERGDYTENHAAFIHFDKQNRIWVGTSHGLFLSEDSENFEKIEKGKTFDSNDPSQEFWDMVETPEEYLFTTTSAGLNVIPPGETQSYSLDGLKGLSLGDIQRFGNFLLLAEYHRGFRAFDYLHWIKSRKIEQQSVYQHLDEYNIKQFVSEGDSLLWLATTKGLLKVRPSTNMQNVEILQRYTKSDGLPSNYIYGILRDEDEKMWLSTNRGIAQFDPGNGRIKIYGAEDNVQGYEFNTNAYLKSRSGDLYFGGTLGFNRFQPPLNENEILPILQITALEVNDKPYAGDEYMGELDAIRLGPEENTFTLQFTAVDYLSKGDNSYRVKLAGFDENWLDLEEGEIRYTRIPPGKYVFQVLARNGDDQWLEEPKTLEIFIATPWYNTWIAYFIYAALASFIFYQIYQVRVRRRVLKQQLLLEQKEAERLKELDELKNRLITNITHEFRTPLTVVLGLTDEIERNPTLQLNKRLSLIRKNGQNLLQYVNQLLDLARLDARQVKLNLVQDDVIGFLRLLVDSFHSHALSRQIGLQFYSEEEHYEMDFDPTRLQRILTNLLSNAFKFTPEFGKVLVVAKVITAGDNEQLEVKVRDTGRGIEAEKSPHIFDRFYQAEDSSVSQGAGSGIGLALVKELISLMKGEIAVASQVRKGTTFTFHLPVSREARRPEESLQLEENLIPNADVSENSRQHTISMLMEEEEAPLALLIEDNSDVLYFLRSCLGKNWRAHTAQNGSEGLEKAYELIPDVIVTDVMMPGMNGFEVVAQLKADERTSHIPVLMLTAKATQADKIEGLTKGADAYLFKPFNKEELLLRLDNFLKMRQRLQEHLRNGQIADKTLTPEQQFLEKVNLAIQTHLDDPDFNSTLLAREVGVGRPQLHRKLKALTNQSTSLYMRSYRLKRAHHLLLTTNLHISEVVWQTGFKSVSWFNQAYKKEFGENPTDTRGRNFKKQQ